MRTLGPGTYHVRLKAYASWQIGTAESLDPEGNLVLRLGDAPFHGAMNGALFLGLDGVESSRSGPAH
ncbi:hypothetical protein HOC_02606 [Hyphomonas oceanitis SCH89]|uniref:Uncharacterized protein n=1 Tax=Hyphomonas oceanitis SCH89 TaxID=1280953 RepID=A0A059GBR9_9PROT|nr:hypothetical protein HOC_02606 [Hyphomonas oceanitis SCH89]